ncbi:MAG TPA: endospore germination permease [Bacillota bacterium]
MKEKKERFLTIRQAVLLIICFSIGGGILYLPNSAAKVLQSGGWLWIFGVGLLVILSGLITAFLMRMFPEDTVVELSQKLLGKPLGITVSLMLILFFFSFVPLEVRILQELVNISLLQQAPFWFVGVLFLLTLAYAASQNIKSMVYVNELLMEIALGIGLAVTALAWQHFDPIHLLPVFGEVRLNLAHFREELGVAYIYTGFPVIFFLVPYFKLPQKVVKATFIGTVFLTLIYTFFTLTVLGVFGYKETLNLAYPGLELAKSVNLETVILERLDLVLIVSWISAIFTTCLVSYFFTALAISKLCGFKSHSPVAWALAPLTYYLSTLLTNYFVWKEFSAYLGLFALLVTVILPGILLIIALLKRRSMQGNQ